MKYLKKTIKTYLSSFTKPKLLGIVFVFDLLFIISIYLSYQIITPLLKAQAKTLGMVNLNQIADLTELSTIASTLRTFFTITLTILIVYFLLITILYSLFQGLAWCKILKKKFTINYLKKFSLLNLVWFLAAIFLFIILLVGAKQKTAAILLTLLVFLFSYFSLLLAFFFTKENKIKKAFKKLLIMPVILIIATFFIISRISLLFQNLEIITIIISSIISISLFSWVKIYISDAI